MPEPQNEKKVITIQYDTSVLSARRDRLRAVFNKRACTSAEIFAADFGHWPPQGLTVATAPPQPLQIKSIFNIAAATRAGIAGAQITRQKDNACNAPQNTLSRLLQSLQTSCKNVIGAFSSARDSFKANGTTAYVMTHNPRREIFMRGFNHRDDGENTLAHEHIHVLQNDRAIACRPGAFDNLNTEDIYRDSIVTDEETFDELIYLSDEAEIQVRLHIILATAYQFTQQLPQDAQELKCLLYCCGVIGLGRKEQKQMESHIENILREGKPFFVPAPEIPAFDPVLEAAAELSTLRVELVRPARQQRFRNVTLPAIYADLISLYGDEKLAGKIRASIPRPR